MHCPLFAIAAAVVIVGGLFPDTSLAVAPVKPASVSADLQTGAVATTYGVLKARKDGAPRESDAPCKVQRGDGIWIDVLDIDKWMQDPKVASRLPQDRDTNRLVPFINGHPLQGVYPDKVKSMNTATERDRIAATVFTSFLCEPQTPRAAGTSS